MFGVLSVVDCRGNRDRFSTSNGITGLKRAKSMHCGVGPRWKQIRPHKQTHPHKQTRPRKPRFMVLSPRLRMVQTDRLRNRSKTTAPKRARQTLCLVSRREQPLGIGRALACGPGMLPALHHAIILMLLHGVAAAPVQCARWRS